MDVRVLNTATRPASSPAANVPGRLGQQATAATPVWQVTGSASCSCRGRSAGSSRRHSCRRQQVGAGPLLDDTLAQAQQVVLPSKVADPYLGCSMLPSAAPPQHPPIAAADQEAPTAARQQGQGCSLPKQALRL